MNIHERGGDFVAQRFHSDEVVRWFHTAPTPCCQCGPIKFSTVCVHLELLYRRHVVAQHAILQHGDGVTLTAHFLNLLTRAVAADVTSQQPWTCLIHKRLILLRSLFVFSCREKKRVKQDLPDTRVTHAVSMVTVGLQFHYNGALKHSRVYFILSAFSFQVCLPC